jgi:hypothetical protein
MVDYWSMATEGGVIDVQAPVNRPAPVQRPGGEMAPRRAPVAPAQPQAPVDYWSQATRPPEAEPAPQQTQPSMGAAPEPDAATWIGRRWQDIRGKQDPSTANLPTFLGPTMERELPDAGQRGPIAANIALGQSDESLAKLIGQQLGPRFRGIRKDANGYDIVQYIGQDGNPTEAYVNRPGLDMQDVARGVASAVPFVAAGGLVNTAVRGASLVPRMLAQATGQGVTALGTDVGAAAGGVADFDASQTLAKSATAAGFGAAGEAVGAAGGAIWRKFVTEPGLYDKAAGQLTPRGAQMAQEAGLDPAALSADLQRQFAQQLARTGSRDTAARSISSAEFGIPRTQGELTQNIPALVREQQVRGGNYGGEAAARMKEFDDAQRQSINDALFGQITSPTTGNTRPGIAQRIAPGRSPAEYNKAELGANIRKNTETAFDTAKAAESKAWEGIPTMRPQPEAMPLLANKLDQAIGEFPIPKGGKAEMMAKELESFIEGKAPEAAAKWQTTSPVGNVDQFRKRILRLYQGAADSTDKAAARTMYETFNEWIDEAAEKSLLAGGDAVAAAKLKTARGISRTVHETFDGERGTAGARILADVLKKADSAEGVINALFTGPTSEIKGGTVSALQNLKTAYDTNLSPEAAKAAWNDIRLAYLLRAVQNPKSLDGEAPGAQALQSSIATMLSKQGSVVRTLYTPEEIGMLRRFSTALQGIERKNINSSWSGISAASFAKDFMGAIIAAFGFKSTLAGTVGNMAGANVVKRAYGSAAASQALSGQPKALPSPSFAGYGGAYGAQQD